MKRARRGRTRLGLDLLAVAVLATLSLLRWGNSLEETGMYLPFIRWLAGTWPAPPDASLELLARLPLGWCHVAALFEARGHLPEALLAGVVVGRIALAAAGVALGAALSGRAPARYGAALLFVLASPHVLDPASFRFLESEALPSTFALPLTLAALALALRGRPLVAGALVGLAANLHPVQAACSAIPIGAAVLARAGSTPRLRSDLGRFVAACTVAALPTAVVVLARAPLAAGVDRARAYELLRAATGGHLFLSMQDREHAASLALLGALALATWESGRRRTRALSTASTAGVAVAVAGLVLADARLLPVLGLKLCLARAALVSKGAVLAFVGARARRWLVRPSLAAASAALLVAGILEAPSLAAAGAVGLALDGLRAGASRGRGESRERGYAALALALGALVLSAPLGPGAPDLADTVRALVIALGLVVAGRLGARAFGLIALFAIVASHHVTPVPGGVGVRWARLAARPWRSEGPWRDEVADFLARETPATARLLAPPEERLLSWLAGRPVVAASNTATLVPWDLRAGAAAIARLDAIGYRFGDANNAVAYHAWSGPEVLAAARKLGATHVVFDRRYGPPELAAPLLYENARYRVYRVP